MEQCNRNRSNDGEVEVVDRYNGKIINIVRKMLRSSYQEISDKLGISTGHFNKIICGHKCLKRTRTPSTIAVYDALFKQALSVPNGRKIFEGMCWAEGVDPMEVK